MMCTEEVVRVLFGMISIPVMLLGWLFFLCAFIGGIWFREEFGKLEWRSTGESANNIRDVGGIIVLFGCASIFVGLVGVLIQRMVC